MKKYKDYKTEDVIEFLRESNFIEGVGDLDSLNQAKKAWNYLIKQDVLTEDVVLKTHKILMKNQALRKDEIGWFRRGSVWIGGKEAIHFLLIPEKIKHWIQNVNDLVKNGKKETKIYLEETIKKQHIEYEGIHGFYDGNGRTGRLFMNWSRLKLNLPILIIKADWPKIDGEQKNYYKWFK